MMKEKVLFIILEQYADWEYSFVASALQSGIRDKKSPYEVKTVSIGVNPVKSIGGFTTVPDYCIEDVPSEFAGLILIGGLSWRTEGAKRLAPIVKKAYADGKIIGAICDATVFLGMNGLLNESKHTSNTREDLNSAAQGYYTGQENYLDEQVVRDGNLITANGTAYLEFTREILLALKAYPVDYIEDNYQFFKLGYIEFLKSIS
jgi:putative intracellular protease/amidase